MSPVIAKEPRVCLAAQPALDRKHLCFRKEGMVLFLLRGWWGGRAVCRASVWALVLGWLQAVCLWLPGRMDAADEQARLVAYKDDLRARLQPFVDRGEVGGLVAMVAGLEGILDCTALGWKSLDRREALRGDALFWVASQTKPVTAAAVLQLVDAGQLRLDDAIADYLPEFAVLQRIDSKEGDRIVLQRVQTPLLVRHLLCHSGGVAHKTVFESPKFDRYPLEHRAKALAMAPLDFEPGTQAVYSNGGYTVLGRLIEVVSGESFGEYVERHLLRPLQMEDTSFWPTQEQCERLIQPAQPDMGWKVLVPARIGILTEPYHDRSVRYPLPLGGLFSTANDLSRFYRMLLRGGELDGVRVLSQESARRMRERQTPSGWKGAFSFGCLTTEKTFGHMGSFGTNSVADVETGQIRIWLTQQSGNPGGAWEAEYLFEKAARSLLMPH